MGAQRAKRAATPETQLGLGLRVRHSEYKDISLHFVAAYAKKRTEW